MAYFDNAATTFPKPEEVYSYMDQFYRECGASAGRGHYSLSQNTSKMVADTRVLIQELLHCPAKNVVFTYCHNRTQHSYSGNNSNRRSECLYQSL